MQSTITLTITTGKLAGQKHTFSDRTTYIIGRNEECNLFIPYECDPRVSRYHCLLDINPPEIRIRDLGSLNGTYINGEKIGGRKPNDDADKAFQLRFPEYDLKNGDEVRFGDTFFQVSIKVAQAIKTPYQQPEENKFFENYKDESENQTKILDTLKNFIKLAANEDGKFKSLKNYQIVKLIGKGSFGEAYLAQHSQTGRYIALKVMLPAISPDDQAVQMFVREIENLRALKHPNIVELWDYNYADNLFFFTMEYYEGGNVYNLMTKLGGKLPVKMAVGITLQVLDGLIYTHNAEIPYVKLANGNLAQGRGLVHRDLKPSNIFLAKEGGKLVAKIGDYGLAKSFDLIGLSGQTFTKTKGGTPGFVSRQQVLKFRKPDPSMDIWAAGACLYHMLSGYVPRNFSEEPWLDVLQNKPIPILNRDQTIPYRLAKVVDLALKETPHTYFHSAEEFKEALLRVFS